MCFFPRFVFFWGKHYSRYVLTVDCLVLLHFGFEVLFISSTRPLYHFEQHSHAFPPHLNWIGYTHKASHNLHHRLGTRPGVARQCKTFYQRWAISAQLFYGEHSNYHVNIIYIPNLQTTACTGGWLRGDMTQIEVKNDFDFFVASLRSIYAIYFWDLKQLHTVDIPRYTRQDCPVSTACMSGPVKINMGTQ